jgi:hypothetical protein
VDLLVPPLLLLRVLLFTTISENISQQPEQ